MSRRRSSPLRSSIAIGTAALTVACHSYVPIGAADVTPSREVRLDLTDAGSVAVGPAVGPSAVAIDGRVTQSDDSVLVVTVSRLTRRSGAEETWSGEAVRVPRAGVSAVTVEQLSRGRTGLMVGGLVALGVVIGAALGSGGGVAGRTDGGTPPGNK